MLASQTIIPALLLVLVGFSCHVQATSGPTPLVDLEFSSAAGLPAWLPNAPGDNSGAHTGVLVGTIGGTLYADTSDQVSFPMPFMTIRITAYIAQTSGRAAALSFICNNGFGAGVNIQGTGPYILSFSSTVGAPVTVAAPASVQLNTWLDYVVTADSSGNILFYINGVAAGSGSIGAPLTGHLGTGEQVTQILVTNAQANEYIDLVQFYNAALPPSLFSSWESQFVATGTGDPQFVGFQGQSFQFHGFHDAWFNLISSMELQLNSHFVYLASGVCTYNTTECWTHPGTYMNQFGMLIGNDTKLLLTAGEHQQGLTLSIMDHVISYHEYQHKYKHGLSFPITFTTSQDQQLDLGLFVVTFPSNDHVVITTPMLQMEFINADEFFNFQVALHASDLLSIGSHSLSISSPSICSSMDSRATRDLISARLHDKYAKAVKARRLHGLVGQTWRSVKVCDQLWEGTVNDYLVEGAYDTEYTYNVRPGHDMHASSSTITG